MCCDKDQPRSFWEPKRNEMHSYQSASQLGRERSDWPIVKPTIFRQTGIRTSNVVQRHVYSYLSLPDGKKGTRVRQLGADARYSFLIEP